MTTALEKTGPGNELKHRAANCPLCLTASMCPGKGLAHVSSHCPRQNPDQDMVSVQPIPAGSMHQANTDQPPLFPLPVPSIPFLHCLQTLQGIGHILSFTLRKCHSNNPHLFRKRKSQQKKHKHTNDCILGPWKGSNCLVKWIWSGLGT